MRRVQRLIVRDDGNVYRLVPNPDVEDAYEFVPPADLLAAARRILSEDLLADALEIAAVQRG